MATCTASRTCALWMPPIMPDCIRANTNVTTMMIGERIADFIRQGR